MPPSRLFSVVTVSLFSATALLPLLFICTVPFREGVWMTVFEARHIPLALKSLGLSAGTTAAALLIGLPVSLLLTRTDMRGRNLLFPLFMLPMLIPPHIHAIVWNRLGTTLKTFFSFDIHSLAGATGVLTLAYYPFIILLTVSGMNAVDRNMEEAALLIHGKRKTLFRITLPLVFPHIFSGAVFVFIFSLMDFGVPDILRVNVYPVEIFIQFSAFYNEKAAVVLSLPLMALTILLVVFQRYTMKNRAYIQVFGGIPENPAYPLAAGRIPGFLFCALILALSVLLPLAASAVEAGRPDNYLTALKSAAGEIRFTLLISALSAVFITALGFSASFVIRRTDGFQKHLLEFGAFLLLAVPSITAGIVLIRIWNRPPTDMIYTNPPIITLGHAVRFLPFAVILLSSGIGQMNPRMEEASALCCRSRLKTAFRILLPLSVPSLAAAFFIVFALSFGEMGTSLLLMPPGKETVTIKIYNLMHYGSHEQVAALNLMLTMLIFGSFGIFLLILKKLSDTNTHDRIKPH